MDNGHHNAIFSSPDVDDNLNEENWQRSLEISAPAGMPTPEQIIASGENAEKNELSTPENTNTPNAPAPENPIPLENPQPFGQITPISGPQPQSANPKTYNPVDIKTTGDRLEKSTIPVIDNAISELNQTGNLSNFYDEIRGMTEVNLNNSFNRKLYDNGAGGTFNGHGGGI